MIKNLTQGLNIARSHTDDLLIFSKHAWDIAGSQDRIHWLPPQDGYNRFLQEWRTVSCHIRQLDTVLFSNYFTSPTMSRKRPRLVTVIHDLNSLHFPDQFSWKKRTWLRLSHQLTLQLAHVVVVPSNFVKQDILHYYGLRWQSKVHVIPNPVSWDRFNLNGQATLWDRLKPKIDYPNRRYILSVAAQYPHKNLETVIRAFAILRERTHYKDASLILVGQISSNLVGISRFVNIARLIKELKLGDAVYVTGHIKDKDLGELYRHAAMFIFPSLFEGFGMPPLEALGFGVPVLTTRCASIPETTLGLARYLDDPLDGLRMADQMAVVLDRPNDYRPSSDQVDQVREYYAPERIGKLYYEILVQGLPERD